ncbi:NAD(P)-binding protein [Bimuria novae-zelandiae CBS 107.79]|uniref:NAD(P)-binding protein n=1 Tax=Bimuria novae-zelandiae CBS 107.79 TaxID=1447943 RepID=A0A6A5V852_9PLEO|nr:NAD(P)-binding protein [Bimuria novae-zelandiae CBS 107.79]
MSKGTVLISGLNGYIAAVTAKHFLDNDYKVRGTVRRLASAESLTTGPLMKYAESGALEVVEVPDITVDGAFDEAVKGVTGIAHLATPVAFDFPDGPEPVMKAAIQGTQTILNSALKAGPQLKSFVVLSSIAAVRNLTPPPYTFTEKDWNDFAEPMVMQNGKDTPGFMIYVASKAAAEKAFWAWRDEKKPSFAMSALNPVFVIGPALIPPKSPAEVGGTVKPVFDIFSGNPWPPADAPIVAGLGHIVDVRDVAAQTEYAIAHPKEVDGERYISYASVATAQSIADILRKAFPEAMGRIAEGTPGQGYNKDYTLFDKTKEQDIDGSKGKKLLPGGEYIPHEQSIIDTAKNLAHLV